MMPFARAFVVLVSVLVAHATRRRRRRRIFDGGFVSASWLAEYHAHKTD